MAAAPEQVEAAEQSVEALHLTSAGAKVQLDVQQTPSDGEQDANLVLVHGVRPSAGSKVFDGTQQSAWQSSGSDPQSHSSQPAQCKKLRKKISQPAQCKKLQKNSTQPSTTELPQMPCNGFTLQQPRLIFKLLFVYYVNDNVKSACWAGAVP